MCTYLTQTTPVQGSGKGSSGWFPLTVAMVSVDHPVHAPAGHTLNLDFLNPDRGPAARVAVELTLNSARSLLAALAATLAAVPADLEP